MRRLSLLLALLLPLPTLAEGTLPGATAPGFSYNNLIRAKNPIPTVSFIYNRVSWILACHANDVTCEVWDSNGNIVGNTKMQFQPASNRIVFNVGNGTDYYQVAWVTDRNTVNQIMAQALPRH